MRILLLCVATFVVGLLVGTLVLPGPESRRRRAPAAPPRSQSPVAGRADEGRNPLARALDAELSPRAGGERFGDVRVRDLAGEAADELERVVTSERAEAAFSGDGTISGTVRDPAGDPVAGVVVTALPEAQPFGLALSARRVRERAHEDRDLGDAARDAIQGELWRRHARQVARTGPDGRFELRGLMDAAHTLTAFHDVYEVKPSSQQGKIVPDAVVDFLAQPVVEVRVEVRMPDGALAENAWLSWEGPHGTGWGSWTPEPGTARLPVGTCTVKAQTWLPEPLQSEEVERAVGPSAPDEPLVLQLEGRRMLTARLVFPDGFVTPRTVEYRLGLLVDAEEVDPAALLKDKSQPKGRSRSPGRAYWFDLEPGRYLVAAFLDRRRLLAHAEVEVGAGPAEIELVVEEPAPGEHLAVKLLGPDGGPVGQASFHVAAGRDGGGRYQRAEALQRGDATWLVLLSGLDFGEADEATLRVGTREYGSALDRFRPGNPGALTIRFDKPASLRVSVAGYAGSGLEGKLYVALRSERGVATYGQVSGDGRCEPSAVQPGSYGLLLVISAGKTTWSILQQRIGLEAGDNERSVSIPSLHSLRVRVPGKPPARNVTVRCGDPVVGNFKRDARLSGRVATFHGLAAGAYEIRCGARRATVRVPGPPEVILE